MFLVYFAFSFGMAKWPSSIGNKAENDKQLIQWPTRESSAIMAWDVPNASENVFAKKQNTGRLALLEARIEFNSVQDFMQPDCDIRVSAKWKVFI